MCSVCTGPGRGALGRKPQLSTPKAVFSQSRLLPDRLLQMGYIQSRYVFDPATETLDRAQLRARQLQRVQALFEEILPRNGFYAAKFGEGCRPTSWEQFQRLPFTTK